MQRGSEKSDLDFLNELKSQFDRDLKLKENLDSKSTTMITMSSTIMTILISIGTFLVAKIEPKTELFTAAVIILILGTILAATCVVLLIRSYSIKKYRYPMGHEEFFDKEGNYKKSSVEKFRDASKEDFAIHIMKEYLESIKFNVSSNEAKSSKIKIAQWFLLGAIGSIVVLLGFVLISSGAHLVSLNF